MRKIKYMSAKFGTDLTKSIGNSGITPQGITSTAAGVVDALDAGNEYGNQTQGTTIAKSALSGASAGMTFGPIGAGVGALVGAGIGLINSEKTKNEELKMRQRRQQQSKDLAINATRNMLNNDPSSFTGERVNMYKFGGLLKSKRGLNKFEEGGNSNVLEENTQYPPGRRRVGSNGFSMQMLGLQRNQRTNNEYQQPTEQTYPSRRTQTESYNRTPIQQNQQAVAQPSLTPSTTYSSSTPVNEKQPLADEGAAFTRNWARERARTGYMGMTQQDVSGIKTPVVLPDAEVQAEAQRTPGNLPTGGRSGGYYDSKTDSSVISDGARDVKSNATHESTHDWQRDTAKNHAGSNVNPIRQSYSNIQTEVNRSGKPTDAYFGSPNEVHARIMESRAKLGLKPGEVVTQEHIDKLKQENPRKYNELSKVLDDEGIINSFNKTVMNNTPKQSDVTYAKFGGKVRTLRKYEEGGETGDQYPPNKRRISGGSNAFNMQVYGIKEKDKLNNNYSGSSFPKDKYNQESKITRNNETLNNNQTAFSNSGRLSTNATNGQEAVQEGAEYTRNWAKQRAAQGYMGMNRADATGISTPTAMTNQQMSRLNDTEIHMSSVPLGDYDTGKDRAYVNTDRPLPNVSSTATHESTHDWQNTMDKNHGSNGPIEKSYSNIKAEQRRSGIGNDPYFGSPDEIHARIMQGRAALNMTPDNEFTNESLEELKRKLPEKYKELRRTLDDQGIINSFNKTVMNDKPQQEGVAYALLGGRIKKLANYEEGGAMNRPPSKWARIVAENKRKAEGESISTEPVGFSEADKDQQRANNGAEFTRDWIKQREQRGDYGLKPSDKFEKDIENPTILPMGKKGNVLGAYSPAAFYGNGEVKINSSVSNPNITSTATHETTHQFQNSLGADNIIVPANNAWKQSESTINNELKRVNKSTNEYYTNPQEVHARVMQLRQDNGFKPGQTIDKDTKIRNSKAYKELQGVLDEEGIRNVLNNTVSNDNTNYDPTVAVGKFGGKLKSFDLGGPKIPRKYDYSNGSSYNDANLEQGILMSRQRPIVDRTPLIKPTIPLGINLPAPVEQREINQVVKDTEKLDPYGRKRNLRWSEKNDALGRNRSNLNVIMALGGHLKQLNSTDQLVVGRSHAKGGVKFPEEGVELEGKETKSGDFIFSHTLGFAKESLPLMKAKGKIEKHLEQNKHDPVAQNSLSLLTRNLENMKVEQQQMKADLGIGEYAEMATGGPVPKRKIPTIGDSQFKYKVEDYKGKDKFDTPEDKERYLQEIEDEKRAAAGKPVKQNNEVYDNGNFNIEIIKDKKKPVVAKSEKQNDFLPKQETNPFPTVGVDNSKYSILKPRNTADRLTSTIDPNKVKPVKTETVANSGKEEEEKRYGIDILPFVSNTINALRKIPGPIAPTLATTESIPKINLNARRANLDLDVAAQNKALEGLSTNQRSALKGTLAAKKASANNEITDIETRANTDIASRNLYSRQQTNLYNNQLQNRYNDDVTAYKLDKIKNSQNNISNAFDKAVAIKQDRIDADNENKKLKVLTSIFSPSVRNELGDRVDMSDLNEFLYSKKKEKKETKELGGKIRSLTYHGV